MRRVDLINRTFGKLTAVRSTHLNKRIHYFCRCSCGACVTVRGSHLTSGKIRSCGCLRAAASSKRMLRHGLSSLPEMSIWAAMRSRCLNSKVRNFHNYGGRGIKICERWLTSFENFLADMGRRPSRSHSIDRRNNDGDYEPDNCRWATKSEQLKNTRRTVNITAFGKTQSMVEWSREKGVPEVTIRSRILAGIQPEIAVTVRYIGWGKLKKS